MKLANLVYRIVNLAFTRNATTVTVTNSEGNDAQLPAATASLAGVMAAASQSKLNGIEPLANQNVATNLDMTPAAGHVTITSSTGTNTTIPGADQSNAGVMSAADKTKLNIGRFPTIPQATTFGAGRIRVVNSNVNLGTPGADTWEGLYNNSASAIDITASGGLTLRLAGTSSTGTRTLAGRGLALVWYRTASEAIIAGQGVS